MQKKEIKISLEDFPTPLHCLLKNAKIYDSSCSTEMRVLYSDLGYYVKIAEKDRLKNEAKMAGLFAEKKLGPRLVSYISGDKDYMVTESAVGEDALHYLDKPERLCEALCDAMKIMHSTPISGIPISPCMDIYTSEKHGILLKQDTFIHGDFCLPNVILNDGKFASFIDLGGAGRSHIQLGQSQLVVQNGLQSAANGIVSTGGAAGGQGNLQALSRSFAGTGSSAGSAAGGQGGQHHGTGQDQRKFLLHICFLQSNYSH